MALAVVLSSWASWAAGLVVDGSPIPKVILSLVLSLALGALGLFVYIRHERKLEERCPANLEQFLHVEDSKHEVPNEVDAYESLCTIGTGGFSTVKMVKQAGTKQIYALKAISIHKAFDEGQVRHILDEKEVLLNVRHPFMVQLHATFRDQSNVYFLMEFINGGELFDIIKEKRRLPSDAARFYAANVIVLLEYLHARRIAYRDLKSENLLLDSDGYLKFVDFGMAKYVSGRCNTFAGTLDYLSPEMLTHTPYKEYVDWWALGCLIYEMLTGRTPFKGDEEHRLALMRSRSIPFEEGFDPVARSLICRLLHPDLSKRLGASSECGAGVQIRRHPWFEGFDWAGLMKRQLSAPFVKKKFVVPSAMRTPLKVLRVRDAVEEDVPESPRTFSPKAIDSFFKHF